MRNRPPPGLLAPDDDGIRFVVERRGKFAAAFFDEATARLFLKPGDTLWCVYRQAILPSEEGDCETERLDMHGIALVPASSLGGPLRLAWTRSNQRGDATWEATAGHLRLVVFDRTDHAEWDVCVGMATGELRRARTLLDGQIAAEEEGRQILGEMAMAYESTPTDELLRARFLMWRGIQHPEDVCRTCDGAGVRMYSNTSTWRRGVGGAMMTSGVCDQCWGSGDRFRPGADLRKLAEEEGDRVAARAVDILASSCGASLSSARGDIHEIVRILRAEADKADRARKGNGLRSHWFGDLVRGLADTLERATRAK